MVSHHVKNHVIVVRVKIINITSLNKSNSTHLRGCTVAFYYLKIYTKKQK